MTSQPDSGPQCSVSPISQSHHYSKSLLSAPGSSRLKIYFTAFYCYCSPDDKTRTYQKLINQHGWVHSPRLNLAATRPFCQSPGQTSFVKTHPQEFTIEPPKPQQPLSLPAGFFSCAFFSDQVLDQCSCFLSLAHSSHLSPICLSALQWAF